MNSKIEKQENSVVSLTLLIPPDKFEDGMKYSYNKNKKKINMPGFRKGKVPRMMIEKVYGREFFYDDAIDFVFPEAYRLAVKEHGLDTVSRPEISDLSFDEENGLSLVVSVTVKPVVTLGEYKGLSYEDYEISVDEKEINDEVEKEREKNARLESVTDRAVENGDIVNIDYEGFSDGVPFEGGKAEGRELTIGSNSFVDTFEQQLIGKNIGDSLEVLITFPEQYHSEQLAGKPAVFNVKINDIIKRELPALDDNFAQDISEFDTLEEYKGDIKDKLYKQKEKEKEDKIGEELLKKACENASVDIPEIMIENQTNQMIREFEAHLRTQGISLELFLKYSGEDFENIRDGYKEQAEKDVLARLVLEQIAKTEGILPSEEEINGEIARIAKAYSIDEEKMHSILRDEDLSGIKTDLQTQKAFKVITESAVKA